MPEPSAPTLPLIQRTDVDGVPVLWADAPGQPILALEQHTEDIIPYPLSSTDAVAGREVKPLLSVLGFGPRVRLTIGPDGVTLRTKDGAMATVRYADCVVLERPKDDELVLCRDLSRVYVPAAFWRGGEEILAEIEAALPPEIVIRDIFSPDYIDD